jgi:four helix bundle protein
MGPDKEKLQEDSFFFENLDVYQRGLQFAIQMCKLASSFPTKFTRIRDQLIGAAISIPLNIAEGSGRKSIKERRNFYKISRSSVFECVPAFEICVNLGLIDNNEYEKFREETKELSKMINGLIKSL